MIKKILIIICCLSAIKSYAESNIRIVGSKSLYYFLAFIVEDYTKLQHKSSPIIEASGSGSGINLLCSDQADIAASSREITKKEREICRKNGIINIEQFILGKDAVIIASSKKSKIKNLSSKSLYNILAYKLAFSSEITDNFYYNWNQIDKNFPDQSIEIYGPYVSSGTRHLVMERLANKYCLKDKIYLKNFPQYEERYTNCVAIRNDSRYIEIGENQNLLVNKLVADENALAILSYSHALLYQDQINLVTIDNIFPNKMTIAKNIYPFSRELYLYYDKDKFDLDIDKNNFLTYLKTSAFLRKNNFLTEKGLIFLLNKEDK